MKSVAGASISRSTGCFTGFAPGGLAEPSAELEANWAIAVLAERAPAISIAEARMAARLCIGAFQLETGPACCALVPIRSLLRRAREEIEQDPDQAVKNRHLHAAEPVGLAVLRDLADDQHAAEDCRHLGSREENVDRIAEKRRDNDQDGNDKEGDLSGGAYADLKREVHLVRLRHFDRAEQRRHIADQGNDDHTDKKIGPAEGLF